MLHESTAEISALYTRWVTIHLLTEALDDRSPQDLLARLEAMQAFQRRDAIRCVLLSLRIPESRIVELEQEAGFNLTLCERARSPVHQLVAAYNFSSDLVQ